MKHRLLTCVFILFACLTVVGQVNQVWWSKGRVLHVNSVEGIDSVTYGQFINADTFLIVIDRASRRIVYDTVDKHLPGMVFHDTIHTTYTVYLEPGRRIGVFSVAEDRQVSFSQGNLQYIQSTDTWQFAEEQTEYIGKRNLIDENVLADTIDLFGWSGEDSKIPFGVNVSCNRTDYAGDFVDWGVNIIHSNLPNIWRTLSYEEWDYIVNQRQNAQNLYGMAAVNGVDGLILLPDDWVCPENITFISGYSLAEKMTDYSSHQMFTLEQWHELENLGAVFIPAAGGRNESGTHGYSYSGGYWCSNWDDEAKANVFHFYSSLIKKANQYRYWGFSVRLVHDTIVPKVEPEYVDLGLSVKWATFNVGAERPEEYGDYFAWGEVEPKEKYGWETYKWCDGTASNMTKYNKTDGLTTLELDDDAAHVNWGGKWRMPSKVEMQELFEKCTWVADTVNGISGQRATGPNGNSIFIPTAGYYNHDHGEGIQGLKSIMYLWTSSCNGNSNAYDFMFYHSTLPDGVSSNTRRVGFPIRPIFDESVVTFTINCTPEDASVGFYYSGGFHAHGNSVLVKKGASTLYQVEATKEGYLSQGDTLHNITKDTTLNITLMPFSEGTWVEVDNSEFTQVDSYFVSKRTGGFVGPHSNWSYFYAPAIPGETYRVCARAGQLAAIWYAASNAPNLEDSIRPTKVDCSENGGITRYIAEEFTIPEGATYLIINDASRGKDLVIERKVPDPCLVVRVNDTLAINMMCVEGGTFMMGKGTSGAHQVTLSDYYMGQTEVTQELWEAVMGEDVEEEREGVINVFGDKYPMAGVSVAECRQFVERLNQLTGLKFRIPTEAEWEYAAIGGKHSCGYTYAGSNDINEVARWKGNSEDYYGAEPVMSYKPNELGIYDMSGNMCEWVSDWYAPYNLYPQINPTGNAVYPATNLKVICRGGCWTYEAKHCLPTYRNGFVDRGANGIGFRLALSDEEPFRAVYVNDTTRFYLRKVEAGSFMMGAKDDDPIILQNLAAKGDELPQHKVTLDSDYYVAEYEVTQSLWEAVMGMDVYDMHAALTKPSASPNPVGAAYPMYYVYTKDILEFTRKLSQMTGLNFRLPTEAEWEYAARGGNQSHGYFYAGSNNVDSVAWYGAKGMHQVGQLMPNELGLYDMSGNALERCIDYLEYHEPYESGEQTNPRGKIKQSGNRAYRGGAHGMHKDSVRVTHRAPQTPTFTSLNVGTRLVMNEDCHFQTFNVGSVWFDMIYVKGGTFMMGDDTKIDTSPAHEVTLSDYYIGQLEVTQALWKAVMGSNPSNFKGNNLPVECVSWEDCQLFVQKLSQMTGHRFRLPTEAEWEYAARGGVKSCGYTYSGTNNIDSVAWYSNNSDNKTHNFAKKKPNELGIYDMTGNVWEWCQDWHEPYTAETQTNPQGATTGKKRVMRGGCYHYNSAACTTTNRHSYYTPEGKGSSVGLRVVLEVE